MASRISRRPGSPCASAANLLVRVERELRLFQRILPRRVAGARMSVGVCLREMREIERMRDMLRDSAGVPGGFFPNASHEQEDTR